VAGRELLRAVRALLELLRLGEMLGSLVSMSLSARPEVGCAGGVSARLLPVARHLSSHALALQFEASTAPAELNGRNERHGAHGQHYENDH
jgi:hypothetical protein